MEHADWDGCYDEGWKGLIVQEAFAKAWSRWRDVARAERPGAWVQTVAVRLALRRRARRRRGDQLEAFAQHFDDGLVGRDLGRNLLAVEGEVDRAAHVGLTVVVAQQPRVRRASMCPLPLREGSIGCATSSGG